MAAKIIAIVQQKGGAGKTTLAAHLAVAAAEAGQNVIALDIDPQGSLSAWGGFRAERAPALAIAVEAIAGHRVRDIAARRGSDYDLIVIDAPPHADTETRQALRAADLAIAPVQPSPLDLWASTAVLEAAEKANCPLALVLNKTPPRARLVDEIAAAAAKLGAPLLTARLGARVAFAEAMGQGLTAIETAKRSVAAEEVRALYLEVSKRL